MSWTKRFWNEHGDRLIFVSLAFGIAVGLYLLVPEMRGEAKTVIIGVMMLLFNKARSVSHDEKEN